MKTVFLRDLPDLKNTVVTIGAFDGIHLGHQAILRTVAGDARSTGRESVLLTFDRHPRSLARREEVSLITSPEERGEILAATGIDRRVLLDGSDIFGYSPERFIDFLLVRKFGAREVVVGFNFRFGRQRTGDVVILERRGTLLGFKVKVLDPVRLQGEIVSSTLVRQLLAEGRVEEAAHCLGRFYQVRGLVEPGRGRGTGLGFPTANVRGDIPPLVPAGLYEARVSSPEGIPGLETEIAAAAYYGTRPTFEAAGEPALEVHIPGFSGDLAGRRLFVSFVKRRRGEERFPDGAALVRRMREDIARLKG